MTVSGVPDSPTVEYIELTARMAGRAGHKFATTTWGCADGVYSQQ